MAQIQLLSIKKVSPVVGLGRTSIYFKVKSGEFPSPVKRGRSSLWPSDVIDDYVATIARGDVWGAK